MFSKPAAGGSVSLDPVQVPTPEQEKAYDEPEHLERVDTIAGANLVWDHTDEEPEIHARTYFALAAMFLLNLVQVFALQGPPAVVRIDRGVRCSLESD